MIVLKRLMGAILLQLCKRSARRLATSAEDQGFLRCAPQLRLWHSQLLVKTTPFGVIRRGVADAVLGMATTVPRDLVYVIHLQL